MSQVDYLLIGGGVASVCASMAIRENDATGSICMVSSEAYMPYDRPPLSKGYLRRGDLVPDDISSKFDNFYPDNNIELRRNTRVKGIDTTGRNAFLDSGQTIRYGKLLIATGSSSARPAFQGEALENVFSLRTIDDCEKLGACLRASQRPAIIGAGYIGVEAAAVCIELGLKPTIIHDREYPWSTFASPTTGMFVRRYLEGKGARFLTGDMVTGFAGTGRAAGINLASGAKIETDCVLVAVGAKPNSDFLADSGLKLASDGSVLTDQFLQTSDPNIWAAGDIANFKDIMMDANWHLDHHLNAKWQGQTAGENMAGSKKAFSRIPYFWSDFLDLGMILRGNPTAPKDSVILGSVEEGEYIELYHGWDSNLLAMGIAFSRDSKRLDAISAHLERLILRSKVDELTAADFV